MGGRAFFSHKEERERERERGWREVNKYKRAASDRAYRKQQPNLTCARFCPWRREREAERETVEPGKWAAFRVNGKRSLLAISTLKN